MNKSYVIIEVNNNNFCIESNNVVAIIDIPKINKVPLVKNHMKGIINFRNEPVMVIDLNILLNNDTEEYKSIIVVKDGDQKFGILVKEVLDIIDIENNEIKQSNINDYISGIYNTDKIYMILDTNNLIR